MNYCSLAQASGKYRQEGKTYVVQDGDIIFFKFNVSGGGKKWDFPSQSYFSMIGFDLSILWGLCKFWIMNIVLRDIVVLYLLKTRFIINLWAVNTNYVRLKTKFMVGWSYLSLLFDDIRMFVLQAHFKLGFVFDIKCTGCALICLLIGFSDEYM